VLADPEKRQLYDQHGHAGVDGRYSTEDIFRGAGANFDDVFSNLFGGRGRQTSGGFNSIFENLFGGGRDLVVLEGREALIYYYKLLLL